MVELQLKWTPFILQTVKQTLERNFEAKVPMKRRPKMKMYDVPTNMSVEELTRDVHKQNFDSLDFDDFKNKFKIIFKVGLRDEPLPS